MPKSPAALIGRHNRQRRPEEQNRYEEAASEAMPDSALPQTGRLPNWRRLLNRWARPGQQRLIPAKSTD